MKTSMTLEEYRKDCERTDQQGLDFVNRLNLYSHGLTGEAGEFTDLTKKTVYHAHAFNRNRFAEELGDLFFYLDRAANLLGMDLPEIMERNVAKRAKRFPNGFTSEDSIRRVDVVSDTETIMDEIHNRTSICGKDD